MYQRWLADQLSANGIIDPYEGQDVIDDIVSYVTASHMLTESKHKSI